MKIERQFNKTSATSVEVQEPIITIGGGLCLGMKLTFHRAPEESNGAASGDHIAMHCTPDEAIKFGQRLVSAGTEAALGLRDIIDNLSDDQRRLLLYVESCCVEHGGLMESQRLNHGDHGPLDQLEGSCILTWGRIPSRLLGQFQRNVTHWCDLTDAGWALAHQLRRQQAAKPDEARAQVNAALAERAGG